MSQEHERKLLVNEDNEADRIPGGKLTLLQRVKDAIEHADWKQLLIRNGLLVSLLLLITGSLVMVKKTSARLTNYPFTLGQAQPVITSILFGLIYLVSLVVAKFRKQFWPAAETSELEERNRLLEYNGSESDKVVIQEPVHTWRWWAWLYFHLAVVGTFLSIGNILLFSGSRGDYVPVIFLRLHAFTYLKNVFCISGSH